jgi:hypothetical protein
LGIVSDPENPKRKIVPGVKDPIRLTPIVIAAQLADLKSLYEEIAEVGLAVDEATRMESIESEIQGQEAAASEQKGKRRPTTVKVVKPPDHENRLHQQALIVLKQAQLKWTVVLSKVEAILNKSNRLLGRVNEKLKGQGTLDIANAKALANFFSLEFGIYEKAPALVDYLIGLPPASAGSAMPSAKRSVGRL